MPRRKKWTHDYLARLMKNHDGNLDTACEEAGLSRRNLYEKIRRDKSLAAIYIYAGDEGHEPTDAETISRDTPPSVEESFETASNEPPPLPSNPESKKFLQGLKDNGKEVFMNDIEGMIRNPENVGKLKVFEGLQGGVGRLMSNALEVTQKIAIRQNMALFEVAEKLRDDVSGGALDSEEEILRTKLFLQATEQQGKFYDRLLHGLDLMIKLSEKDKKKDKRKPGFRPLKEMNNGEASED